MEVCHRCFYADPSHLSTAFALGQGISKMASQKREARSSTRSFILLQRGPRDCQVMQGGGWVVIGLFFVCFLNLSQLLSY